MKAILFIIIPALMSAVACKNTSQDSREEEPLKKEETVEKRKMPGTVVDGITIHPIEHATLVLEWGGTVIYMDPVGGREAFEGHKPPDIVLVTDIHGDHLNEETLTAVSTPVTTSIVPEAVRTQLTQDAKGTLTVLNNDDRTVAGGFTITGIPMYNLREEALQFHEKGRGNGYVLEKDGKRVYISGDTEDIPEMRSLENIDLAFVCMNLPYTMPVSAAVDAVIEFQPKHVIPYHYRGQDGFGDVAGFKAAVNENTPEVNVVLLDWYPED